ncbi:hypothetical protein C0992_003734 [Termitomyces sp. T32_za158]|nr:hypothetical protein C0992_003734 [Termitomyces sp. T32_za158]
MAAEQGWDIDWVWRKIGKGLRPWVVEVPGGGPMAVEGVPTPASTPRSRPDKGKRKAVSESEAPKHVRRWLSPAPPVFKGGPLESNIFLPGGHKDFASRGVQVAGEGQGSVRGGAGGKAGAQQGGPGT